MNELKDKYRRDYNLSAKWKGDIKESELTRLESTFDVRVNVYELLPELDNTCRLMRRSERQKKGKNGDMRIDKSGYHYSLITNFMYYAKTFRCELCQNYITKRLNNFKCHKKICTGERIRTSGDRYLNRVSVFNELIKFPSNGQEADQKEERSDDILRTILSTHPQPSLCNDSNHASASFV
ncbi:MAG: hypothetical protein GY737_20420 [Desulfobacteraceae bacterium]|nr:hypothetical protein [Desulfobacteraceae bacterium]